MSDAALDPNAPLPWSHSLRVADLAGRKPTRFDISPPPALRQQIALWAGISELPQLRLKGSVTPKGRDDWMLEAMLTAIVIQPCAVTLVPVKTALHEEVIRHYVTDLPEPTGDEVEIPQDDSLEQLRAEIDLAAVALEALELALPLYPRAESAIVEAQLSAAPDGAAPLDEDTARPFANLRDLLKNKEGQADSED